MALIGRRIKRFTGTLTTDGVGAATVDIVPGSAGGVTAPALLVPSYKLIAVDITNGDAAGANPLTGGTVVVRDNSGAGSAVNYTITQSTDLPAAGSTHSRRLNAPTPVTNVRITVASGGATKTLKYRMVFARTRAH